MLEIKKNQHVTRVSSSLQIERFSRATKTNHKVPDSGVSITAHHHTSGQDLKNICSTMKHAKQ